MNSRSLSGVLMLGGAAALAWAWLTGRLNSQIAQVVGVVQGKAAAVNNAGARIDQAQRRGERAR